MWLHHTRENNDFFDAINEIEKGPDRAAAIVASAFVEDHLTSVLKSQFHQNEKLIRELFEGTGPLAPFSTKIKLAFLTGLISMRASKELQTIRKIRNEFAHKLANLTFESQKIKDLAMTLTIPEWYIVTAHIPKAGADDHITMSIINEEERLSLDNPRNRYLLSCRCFLTFFTIEKPGPPRTPRI